MGEEEASTSSSSRSRQEDANEDIETNVVLNVYDLTPLNNYTYWFGFGIFHSGIEVHGKEYGFGAHNFPVSGVFEVEPRSCPGFIFRCSIPLGHIKIAPSAFRMFVEGAASEYHGDTYHLISKNCNHFTDEISHRLTGKHIPGWVNRLAQLGSLCSCLLPESLQVTAVTQLPEYHECTENGSEPLSGTTPRQSIEIYDAYPEKQLLSPLSEAMDVTFVKEAPQL
ncbi:hypothetical protein SLA2020_188660 [Shorea laevis]